MRILKHAWSFLRRGGSGGEWVLLQESLCLSHPLAVALLSLRLLLLDLRKGTEERRTELGRGRDGGEE